MACYARKKCKNGKKFSPLELSPWWLDDGQKKSTFHPLWPKSNVLKVQVPNFDADLGVGSHFGPLRRQKSSKSNFFSPQNRDFAGLMMGTNFNFGHSGKSYKGSKCHSAEIFLKFFFDILVC